MPQERDEAVQALSEQADQARAAVKNELQQAILAAQVVCYPKRAGLGLGLGLEQRMSCAILNMQGITHDDCEGLGGGTCLHVG